MSMTSATAVWLTVIAYFVGTMRVVSGRMGHVLTYQSELNQYIMIR